MKWLAIIIILSATARAAQTNWPSAKAQPVEQAEKAKSMVVERSKLKAEKQKNGKKEMREFPLMFDIADKASKQKAKEQKEKKSK